MDNFFALGESALRFPPLGSSWVPRVLVVDDDPSVRVVLLSALRNRGYELIEATDGREALERVRAGGVDLVLSDLLMPHLNGIQLLKAAKEIDEDLSFIVLTGAATLDTAIEALRSQADDYLMKPFQLEEVRHAVARSLRQRRLIFENRDYQNQLEARVTEQAQQIERMFLDALLTIANAVEVRDDYTGEHVERVTRYAVGIGRTMGMDEESLRFLWVGGLLHDVGKIGIPDEILKKPGKLTAEEYEVMKRHPLISAAIVERSEFLRPALPGILHHHERWDGAGYPYGLRGDAISLEGRILAVADAYDAIITTRPYRASRTPDVAIAELQRCGGTQFDGNVVDAFLHALDGGLMEEPLNLVGGPALVN